MDFIVINEKGQTVCDTDDLFAALTVIKREPPGSKLIRTADRKTLAYTTTPKLELDDQPPKRRQRSPA